MLLAWLAAFQRLVSIGLRGILQPGPSCKFVSRFQPSSHLVPPSFILAYFQIELPFLWSVS